MASSWTFCLCVLIACTLFATVWGSEPASNDATKKGHPATALNRVTSECPHGASFYRGCMNCLCEATMTADTRSQFPAHQLRVCAGEIVHDDCPQFTCATAKRYRSITECEGKCTCDEATKITTCERLPCPYE